MDDFDDFDDFFVAEEPVDPRPLRWLAAGSAGVLAAVVVTLVVDVPRGGLGRWSPLVWVVGVVAGMLLLGAANGLWNRYRTARRPLPTDDELRDRSRAVGLLRRGRPVPAELRGPTEAALDAERRSRRLALLYLFLALSWFFSSGRQTGGWFWLHVGSGVVCLGLAAHRWVSTSTVLARGARQGLRARRSVRADGRGTIAR